jgi:hypothetical protein
LAPRFPGPPAAQAAAASEQAILARQQGQQINLERRRGLHGWSRHGVDTFLVALVTSAEEMAEAREELAGGNPTGYVILRVAESEEKSGNANRGLRLRLRLRQIIKSEGLISRPPTTGEREALEIGLDALDIPWAPH